MFDIGIIPTVWYLFFIWYWTWKG